MFSVATTGGCNVLLGNTGPGRCAGISGCTILWPKCCGASDRVALCTLFRRLIGCIEFNGRPVLVGAKKEDLEDVVVVGIADVDALAAADIDDDDGDDDVVAVVDRWLSRSNAGSFKEGSFVTN